MKKLRLIRWGLTAAGVAAAAKWLTDQATQAKELIGDATPRNRWLMVTIDCPPERLSGPGGLPEPVVRVTDHAEVTVRPAPGGRGTELGLRPHEQPPTGLTGAAARMTGQDPRQELRRALREAKSLIETGEVLQADSPPSTHTTLTGKPLEYAIRRAAGEGRL